MEEKQVPEFFKEMLYKQYDESTVQLILKGYNLKRKTTLRVNTLKTNREKIEEELRRNNIEFSKVLWNENALIIENATEKEIKELSFYKTGETITKRKYIRYVCCTWRKNYSDSSFSR